MHPSLPTLTTPFLILFSTLLLIIPFAHGADHQDDMSLNLPPTVSIPNITEGASYNRDITPRILIRSRNLKKSNVTLNGLPYSTETTISTEGKYTLRVAAEDNDNTNALYSTTFIIDNSPPETQMEISGAIIDEKGTIVVTGRAEIVVSSVDTGVSPSGIETIVCRLDGRDREIYLKPITLDGVDDGTHSLYCAATDRAGNREEEKKITFLVTNYPPNTVLTLSLPHRTLDDGSFLASPDTIFSLFASGSPSGIANMEYQIDGGPWISYAPFTIPRQGEHIIRFNSTDRLGNSEPVKAHTVVIDQSSPRTGIHIGDPNFKGPNNKLFVSPATSFKLTATSPVVGVAKTEYRIDTRRWTEYAPFTVAEEGAHLIAFRSIDAIGNMEQLRSQQITVDATPPLTTLSIDGQKINQGDTCFIRGPATITLNGSDALSGLKRTEYRLDGKKWEEYSPLQLTGETHKIEYRSIDRVGNEEETKTVSIKHDPVPPVSTISIGKPHVSRDVSYISERTTITIAATDAGSGVTATEYRIDSGPWRPHTPFTIAAPGKHTIEYRSRDQAGNEEIVRSYPVSVDSSAPVTTLSVAGKLITSAGPVYMQGKEAIELKGTSPVWETMQTEFRLDEGEWSEYRRPITLKEDGEYLLEFRSTDGGDKKEEIHSVTLIVDTTPPESSIMIGLPNHELDGVFHIETGTVLTPSATDDLAGVDRIEYQIKGHAVESDAVPFSMATTGKYDLMYWSVDKAGNIEVPKHMKLVVSPAPTRFSAEDLLLANEIVSPEPELAEEPALAEIDTTAAMVKPDIVAVPPPAVIESLPPQKPANKPFLYWTMGVLQALLIIGVMAL